MATPRKKKSTPSKSTARARKPAPRKAPSKSRPVKARPASARKPASKPASPRKAKPAAKLPPRTKLIPIDVDPARIEETLGKVTSELKHWANKGRYTKVRFKFRGKALLPDLPLAAVAAAEGLTFYWGGILRALIVNFAGKSMLSVELINDSEKKIQQGKEALLSADLNKAVSLFREAVSMDRDNPRAHLNLGTALKLRGDVAGARSAWMTARDLDPDKTGLEADRLLATLDSGGPEAVRVVDAARD